jgi:hypothetical protein
VAKAIGQAAPNGRRLQHVGSVDQENFASQDSICQLTAAGSE